MHQRLRKQAAALVAAGNAVCWRCGRSILPWMAWDLGHDDYDRSIYRGLNTDIATGALQQPEATRCAANAGNSGLMTLGCCD